MSGFPAMAQRLLGKVAIVTGGAAGIGESIVQQFLRNGAKVCIADINPKTAEHLYKNSSDVTTFHCDVTKELDVKNAVEFTVEKFGTLDIMVNNAAIAGVPYKSILDVDIPSVEHMLDVNVKGVFIGMKQAARIMIPAKKGSIISIGSVAGRIGGFGPHAYTGSKHAVVGLTRNVCSELGKYGIRVNCVSPYMVPTQMAFAHLPEEERTEETMKAFRKFARRNANLQGEGIELTTDDVANAVLFLASDEAKYISGADLAVDGGITVTNNTLDLFK